MFNTFSRSVGIAVLAVVALGLAACGESSEEKATKKVCAATSEIKAQIQKLGTLPISSTFVTEVKTSGEAIKKSVGEIKEAEADLPAASKEEFNSATRAFQIELATLIASAVKSSTSGEAALKSAEPKLKASLKALGADYQKAFEGLKCS
jgi:hypothetical protein